MSAGVGDEVRGVCRKCGDVWHVVIAVVGGAVAQVECRECGARHRHRSRDASRKPGPRRARSAGTSTRARSRTPVVEADPSRPVRDFRTSDTYEVGDRVAHARFGEGVVQAVKGPTKVEILFEGGAKTLVQGREAS